MEASGKTKGYQLGAFFLFNKEKFKTSVDIKVKTPDGENKRFHRDTIIKERAKGTDKLAIDLDAQTYFLK